MPTAFFRAFLTYKREQEIRLNGSSQTILPEDLPQPEEKTSAPADATPETDKKATARNNKPAPQPSEKATVAQTEDKAPCVQDTDTHLFPSAGQERQAAERIEKCGLL